MPKVCGIVVAFYPNESMLRRALDAAISELDHLLLIDNTPQKISVPKRTSSAFTVLQPTGNVGVAAAHNLGVEWAIARGYSHVLLLDQDSIIHPGMVGTLLEANRKLSAKGEHVAVVGPVFRDPRTARPAPFVVRKGWRIHKVHCPKGGERTIAVEYLISSGSLIPTSAIVVVGTMEEGLFIDYVDIEWGLRAKAKGFQCFGVCDAYMIHFLGDSVRKLPFPSRRQVPIRSPIRQYYQFRNAILLYKRDYVPLAWVVNDAARLLLKFLYYGLMCPPRLQQAKMMALGVYHGLHGRTGPLS